VPDGRRHLKEWHQNTQGRHRHPVERLDLCTVERDGRRRRVELTGDTDELLNDHERPLVEIRGDPLTTPRRRILHVLAGVRTGQDAAAKQRPRRHPEAELLPCSI